MVGRMVGRRTADKKRRKNLFLGSPEKMYIIILSIVIFLCNGLTDWHRSSIIQQVLIFGIAILYPVLQKGGKFYAFTII